MGRAQEVRHYNFTNFTGVESSIAAQIDLYQSDHFSVNIASNDKRSLNLIKVELRDEKLCLSSTNEIINRKNNKGITVTICAPYYRHIEQWGVGRITTHDSLNTESLYIELAGVGNISFPKGGTARKITISNSGVGNVNAEKLDCVNATVDISGVGGINVKASNKITGELSGIGTLTTHGRALIDIENSGLGKIIRK